MLLLVVLVALVGCSGHDEAVDPTDGVELAVDDGSGLDGGFDLDDDVEAPLAKCGEDALTGGDEALEVVSAHVVVDGELGPICFGGDDDRLVEAWDALATVAPSGQLADLGLFVGFEPDGSDEADTLAFVNVIDDEGESFQMSVNLIEAEADPLELLLTMAHELTHVFTATPAELDRALAPEDCETWDNGEGCYLPDSLMATWIDEFWTADLLDTIDTSVEDDADGADLRCSLDDGFFGAYAATTPEEDFAEAFSAFVFGLDAVTDGQQDRLDWIADRPGLVEFAERADAAGMTPLENLFDVCG